MRAPCVTLLLATLATLAAPAGAQTVQGAVTERDAHRPIAGAVVQLLDLGGTASSGILTDSAGRFTLRAPAPGQYRLRVERIGFRSELSDLFELSAGAVEVHPMAIDFAPISLEGITALGRPRGCTIRENGATVSRVWEEARKALNMLALTQATALVRFDTESFRRELDPETLRVREEQRRAAFDLTRNPFRSIPIDELEEHGYVRSFPDSTVYYGPDAGVLLSDRFLETHCFELSDRADGDTASIGLAFRPARRPGRPDIEGTLWLHRKSSELRSVDYRYVGHGLDVPAGRMGGRIEFEPIPSGGWIVRRWVIRMPVLAMRKFRFSNPVSKRVEERSETLITSLMEEGGEVVAISRNRGSSEERARARLTGAVVDSLTGQPLPGAVVHLSGTDFSATTNTSGGYRFADLPAGSYLVSFAHPKLLALGISTEQRRVVIDPPEQASVDLAVPSAATLLQRYCPAMDVEDHGMVVGFVTDALSRSPVPDARVTGVWRDSVQVRPGAITRTVAPSGVVATISPDALASTDAVVEVTADGYGFFRFCGVPLGTRVEVEARVGNVSGRRSFVMPGGGIVAQNVTLDLR